MDKISIEDFILFCIIGVGGFGKVYLGQYTKNLEYYAIKAISKSQVQVRHTALGQILTEREILASSRSPFVVKLFCAFQDDSNFYFCLEYLSGGNLSTYMKMRKVFSIEEVRFYAAEILLGLEYLHSSLNIIHRDLKPENILLDAAGHAKLTDFGLSKIGIVETYSICGTKTYFSPEQLKNTGYDRMIDYWTYGCILYEMLSGHPPFVHKNQITLFEMIKHGNYSDSHIEDRAARDLIRGLLEKEPKKRLGSGGPQQVKDHPFFASVSWELLQSRRMPSPMADSIVERTPELYDNFKIKIGEPVSMGDLLPGPSFGNEISFKLNSKFYHKKGSKEQESLSCMLVSEAHHSQHSS